MPIALAILTTTAMGIPVALLLSPRRLATIGHAFLLGTGVIFITLLALAAVHLRWSLLNVTAIALAISATCFAVGRRAKSRQPLSNPATHQPHLHLPDIATAVTALAFTLFATLAPLWEWDFWAIWGLKARVFLEAGTIDWRFLESRWNDFVHPDYPLLLPLNFVYASLANGGWDDRWLGLYSVAFGIAALLVVRDLVARELPPLAASALTFAAAAFIFSNFIGLAEAPLIAFALTGLLHLRNRDYTLAAILLGLAASSKNEGLSLFACVVAAMLLFDRRNVFRLWPALAICAPWLVLRKLHALTTDITRGNIVERVVDRLHHAGDIARLLVQNLPDKPIWLLLVIALAFIAATHRNRKVTAATQQLSNSATQPATAQPRNLVTGTALALQLTIYISAYFVTTRGVAWHIATSWPRLSRQLAAPSLVIVMLMLARTFTRADDHAHAEARPDL